MDSRMAVLMLTLFDTVCKFPWGLAFCDITRQLTIDSKFLLFGESCNYAQDPRVIPKPQYLDSEDSVGRYFTLHPSRASR